MKILIMLFVVLVACHPTTPTPVNTPPATEKGICLAEDPGPSAGSCGQERTAEGWLCALCEADRGCVDPQTFTWCVGDKACDDPACGVGKFKRKHR